VGPDSISRVYVCIAFMTFEHREEGMHIESLWIANVTDWCQPYPQGRARILNTTLTPLVYMPAPRDLHSFPVPGHASGEVHIHTVTLTVTDSKGSRRHHKHSSSKQKKGKQKSRKGDESDEEEDEEEQQEEGEVGGYQGSSASQSIPVSTSSGSSMPLWKALDQGSIQGIELRGVLPAGAGKGQGLVAGATHHQQSQQGASTEHPGISYVIPYRLGHCPCVSAW
jgi:hypothetical protein